MIGKGKLQQNMAGGDRPHPPQLKYRQIKRDSGVAGDRHKNQPLSSAVKSLRK
jgi:hypothetical protein